MNTIIWKGIQSTKIDGLLICDLPPISKPPLRVKETTIDGRDGSIYEELGYSSYDKSITIGLRGNFDINQVIKYFTGEGEIIFSNEPNKVYTAKVINQIDYNRLLRFRTAVVTFRVQPHKHKYNETYKETQTSTAEGTRIVVTDSAEASLKTFSIYGKTTQDGTPTPDAPIEFVSAGDGGGVGVIVAGKNLIQYPYFNGDGYNNNGVTYTVNPDGTILVNGTATGNSIFHLMSTIKGIALSQGWVSLFSGIGNSDSILLQADVYVDGEYSFTLQTNDDKSAKRLVSTPFTVRRVGIKVPSGYTVDNVLLKPMLCAVEKETAYEQNKANVLTVGMANGLRGIPVSSGGSCIDANGQQWLCDEIDLVRSVLVQRVGIIENYNGEEVAGTFMSTTGELTDGAKVLYVLDEQIETALTDEEITLLKSNEPTTTIFNDANAYMKVEYFKPFEVFNEGLESSKPIMVLRGRGSVGISVNGVHIFDYTFPDGETEVVIDSEKEDAYLGDVLKNRNMNGEFPTLLAGTNKIEWSGDVESIEILPRSRWL